MSYENGVGNGPSWVDREWQAQDALRLTEVIENSPQNYQYNYDYCYWPGPNSNTYVQWVLNRANISYLLSDQAMGKNYLKSKKCLDQLRNFKLK
jgi:hypothetical protein